MNRKNADRSKQKKKRTAKDIVLDILLVVFLLIAVWSGAYLGRYYYIAKNAQNNFNDLKECSIPMGMIYRKGYGGGLG